MRRKLTLLLLLISVFWQAYSFAASRSLPQETADLAHAVLHWDETAHHHHDDGSYAVDDSRESVAHVQADAAVTGAALLPGSMWQAAPFDASPPLAMAAVLLPAPPLSGLRRPPRTHA